MGGSSVCSYSWDEGETWNSYTFHDETIRVYGVLTEPGEATAIFSIFGSHLGYHKWLIIQVNMEKVFSELLEHIVLLEKDSEEIKEDLAKKSLLLDKCFIFQNDIFRVVL